MKAVMVMFDSLNRHLLPPYGCDWTHAPNFARLARRAATFERSYICSMPCMPARRDFHTGRPNFLHAPWGPLEPFDDSIPEMLGRAGVYTHLASDHYHYWEDGGATYHGRYSSWEFFRGQEGDPFIGQVAEPPQPRHVNGRVQRSDLVNRQHVREDRQFSQSRTFGAAQEFLHRNHAEDNWFLQVECFDPHEPFTVHRSYRDRYPTSYDGPLFDWPAYRPVAETPEQIAEARRNYAALLSKCDASLGDVLDAFDAYDLWQDTMLILWTDHGYLLGEHNAWAKNWMPLVRGGEPHPVLPVGSARARGGGHAAPRPGAAGHRPGPHPARPVRPGADPGHARPRLGGHGGGRSPGAGKAPSSATSTST